MKLAAFGLLFTLTPCVAGAQATLPSGEISVANSPSGTIQITLSWLVNNTCLNFAPIGTPALSISAQSIQISSPNGFFDCPGSFPLDPQTDTITVNVGALPDGTYTATWSFPEAYGLPYPTLAPVTAKFVVSHGLAIPIPIPTISLGAALLMLLTLAVIGWRAAS